MIILVDIVIRLDEGQKNDGANQEMIKARRKRKKYHTSKEMVDGLKEACHGEDLSSIWCRELGAGDYLGAQRLI